MKALVLAAGEGTRLRPLTTNIPKPLLLVAGQPFMSHVLEALSALDIKDIYILVGWKANKIKEYYGDGSRLGLRINYLEQKERMGTAHAIGCAGGSIDEPFVCVNGDVVMFESDLRRMLERHKATGSTVMGAVTVPDPERFGVIEANEARLDQDPREAKGAPYQSHKCRCVRLQPGDLRTHQGHSQIGEGGVRDHRHPERSGHQR